MGRLKSSFRKANAISVPGSIERRTRAELVGFLESAGVLGVKVHPKIEEFLEGVSDIPFQDFEIDSLTLIEMAVRIEDDYGISIAPERISKIRSLNGLSHIIFSFGFSGSD